MRVLVSSWKGHTVSLPDGNDGIAPGGDDRVEEPGQKGL